MNLKTLVTGIAALLATASVSAAEIKNVPPAHVDYMATIAC